MTIDEIMSLAPVIPVLIIEDVAHAVPLGRALVAGGLPVLEITMRTPVASECIERMAGEIEGAVVGAGTVLTPAMRQAVADIGGQFAVSPGLIGGEIDEGPVPLLPGIATATELMRALKSGLDTVKLFPAEPLGGLRTLRALAAPFPRVRFVPTGGIDAYRMAAYIADPAVLAVGGSWMATADHLERGDYEEIRRLTADAVERSMR